MEINDKNINFNSSRIVGGGLGGHFYFENDEGEHEYPQPRNGKETVVWAIWLDSNLTSSAR